MKSQYIALLLISVIARPGLAEPPKKDPQSVIRIVGAQRTALVSLINKGEYNVCYDDKPHAPLDPILLRDLGASCDGRKLYALVLSDLRFMVGGQAQDCSGGHTGSGGTTTPILAWNTNTNGFDTLFEGNVIDMARKPADPFRNCPSFDVSMHHVAFDGLDASKHAAQLEYRKEKRMYQVHIIRRENGAHVKWINDEWL